MRNIECPAYESFVESAMKQAWEYVVPEKEVRDSFAKMCDGMNDGALYHAMHSYAGYCYCVWNRACIGMRDHFKELAALHQEAALVEEEDAVHDRAADEEVAVAEEEDGDAFRIG